MRRENFDFNELVAASVAVQKRNAFAADFENSAGLRAFGYRQVNFAVNRRSFDFRAQSRLNETYRNFAVNVGVAPRENFVRLNRDVNVQVARLAAAQTGLTFAADTKTLTRVDALRNVDFNFAFDSDASFAVAVFAGVFDNLTRAVTAFARPCVRYGTKRRARRGLTNTAAVTVGALVGRGAFGCARAAAVFASFHARDFDFRLLAESGFLESDAQVVTQIRAAFGTGLLLRAGTGSAAEELLENVAHVKAEPPPLPKMSLMLMPSVL